MKTIALIFFGFSILSCVGVREKSSFLNSNSVITKTNRYLYEVRYNSSGYPYALWNFPIRGGYDGIHKMIATIPKGSLLRIDNAKVENNLYGPDTIRFDGGLIYKGKNFNVTFSCTEFEYSQQFSRAAEWGQVSHFNKTGLTSPLLSLFH